jgi:hypothetical protein
VCPPRRLQFYCFYSGSSQTHRRLVLARRRPRGVYGGCRISGWTWLIDRAGSCRLARRASSIRGDGSAGAWTWWTLFDIPFRTREVPNRYFGTELDPRRDDLPRAQKAHKVVGHAHRPAPRHGPIGLQVGHAATRGKPTTAAARRCAGSRYRRCWR